MSTLENCFTKSLQVHTKVVNEVKKLKTADYTAWEIFVNKSQISAGTEVADLGGKVTVAIPAGVYEKFNLRSLKDYNDNDVVIDWGDGYKSYVKNGEYNSTTNPDGFRSKVLDDGEYNYLFQHTYDIGSESTKKFIIRVFGKDYFSINHLFYNNNNLNNPTFESLLCRCFDTDLPIASHLSNLSSFAYASLRLLKVEMPSEFSLEDISNFAHCFRSCKNLKSVSGFKGRKPWKKINSLRAIFAGDINLSGCDFNLPDSVSRKEGYWEAFSGCVNLASYLSGLLPVNGFSTKKVNLASLFYNCSSLKMDATSPSILWNDFTKDWTTYANVNYKTFSGCGATLSGVIPKLWGGSVNDEEIIIKPYLDINGTAKKAEKLATARTITLAGAVTGSQTFDGSSNITINTALVDGITINASQVQGLVIDYNSNQLTNKPSLDYLPLSGGNITGNLQYKGHNLNAASGLVQLNQNGQILSSLLSSNFWNKSEVAREIANSNKLSYHIFEDGLPEDSDEYEFQDNVIYLVPNNEEGNNVYDEYLVIGGQLEVIGTTKLDLSNYLLSSTYSAQSGNFALKSELFSKNYNDLTNKPTIPTKVSDLTNDEGYLTSFTESDPIFTAQSSQFLTLTDFNNYITQLSALVEDL